MNQEELEQQIEELELDEVEPEEFEELVAAFSEEGMSIRKKRKNIRYILYRLKTEAEGMGSCEASLIKERTGMTKKGFKELFESQDQFTGFKFFSINWDVDFLNPKKIVHRDFTDAEIWENIVRSKFPTIDLATGKVVYPDMKVKKKVDDYLRSIEDVSN